MTFQGKMEFKDFSRTPPKIQGLFKTVRTLMGCEPIGHTMQNNYHTNLHKEMIVH